MIYPPILQSSQPAFIADSTSSYDINFSLPSMVAFTEIGHVQIRILRQSNNSSIVKTSKYPDQVIYKDNFSNNKVTIASNDIEGWEPGAIYKIQMRFGTTGLWGTDLMNFASWKQAQINAGTFSEWSTVMMVKPINRPEVTILNKAISREGVESTEETEMTTTPLFKTQYKATTRNESLDKYQFILIDAETNETLEESGWIQSTGVLEWDYVTETAATIFSYRFNRVLENNHNYRVELTYQTTNGYQPLNAIKYDFMVNVTYLTILEGIDLRIDSSSIYCGDNGCIRLYCRSNEALNGNYIITRASEKDNYLMWEDIKFLAYSNKIMTTEELIYTDFTVESGVKYKYALQQENSAGLRTTPLYEVGNYPHEVNFEYSYLYRDGIQLRLMFNQTVNSFKHTTLRSKQDTLGDKYPHLVRNGNAYYGEFPLSGLISVHLDEDQTFFTKKIDGYYYKDELIIPADKFENEDLIIDLNLLHNNIYVERKFREKVEEFLNEFSIKLYKSPTESNMMIGLMNVSMTPQQALGRMLYSFSATAYEVIEPTIENMNTYGLIDIGGFELLEQENTTSVFGQIRGFYKYQGGQSENLDIIKAIEQEEGRSLPGGYKLRVESIDQIWIESYGDVSFKSKILELEAQKAEIAEDGGDTSEVDAEIAKYQGLQNALEGPAASIIKLNINDAEVIIPPNKVYSLSTSINSLSLDWSVAPIIVNYICQVRQVVDESVGVISAVDTSRIWGQISGIFTATNEVLKAYNYDYQSSETYRIYNPQPPAGYPKYYRPRQLEKDILDDATNYNVYKDINILDIIKEETQKQVEYIYNTSFENKDGEITDGTYYYTFNNIVSLDIEADEGTILLINDDEVAIGPTCRYVLTDIDDQNMITSIRLKQPQFCIINYECLTNQMRKDVIGGEKAYA